jgi:polyphosphate kinase
MKEAVKYGKKLKKETTQPSGMPVVSKRRASWVNRLRKTLKK